MKRPESYQREIERVTAQLEEESKSGGPLRALNARFWLVASLPFQKALNDEFLVAGAGNPEKVSAVFCGATLCIGQMIAAVVRHYIARGMPAGAAARLVGDQLSHSVSALLTQWAEQGTAPLPINLDKDGNEIPFDFRTMMSGGGEP